MKSTSSPVTQVPQQLKVSNKAGRLATQARVLQQEVDSRKEQRNMAKTTKVPPPLSVSVADAAEMIGVGYSTLRSYVDSGDLPVVRLGARILIRVAQLEQFLLDRESSRVATSEATTVATTETIPQHSTQSHSTIDRIDGRRIGRMSTR